MQNVLLPTDFSNNAWNAIKYAVHFFQDTECNFYLLHVHKHNYLIDEDNALSVNPMALEEVYAKSVKKRLRSVLKRISKLSPERKHQKFYTLTDDDFFTESIRRIVDEKHIDLIVMGTKGATGLQKIILGTNTAAVITKVKCNTLAIPENATFVKPKEIAFPTDFSLAYNLQILKPISDILEQFKASLRILHVSRQGNNLSHEQKHNRELLEDYFNYESYSFHYLTNKKVEDAIQCFVESRLIDMICMVAKNLNYFQQILFHSRVEKISYHVDRPFLILHEINE